ncbi:MAG TPA: hydroxyacylglutathione hydrolase [Polyangiaceae bacterium]|nr:hydroxyacylglutathione hydrolase [Polyangiaceae bacterium]
MEVAIIPCLKDNYAYLLTAPGSKTAVVVDASEAKPILAALETRGLTVGAILSTHHHADHVDGNQELVARYPGIPVYGSAHDRGRIPGQTQFLADEDAIDVCGFGFRCLLVPGHTLGAVAYFGQGAVFTGDTLFAAGCGRLFEGTPAMMHDSLNVKLGSLPAETRVYCGHEYTASNLRFAAHVEPGNGAITERAARVAKVREKGEPSVPSTLAEERATNPFLRCDSAEIIASVGARLGQDKTPGAVLGAIRAAKDAF